MTQIVPLAKVVIMYDWVKTMLKKDDKHSNF